MKSKICGIPTIEVAQRVIKVKPDAIGIYCWKEAEKGANFTNKEVAREIVGLATKNSIETFYLTYATTAREAYEDCSFIGNSHIQLLGDISLAEISKLKQLLPVLQTVKVIGVTGNESLKEAEEYNQSDGIDALLLDSRSGSVRGGTGKTHDWNLSKRVVERSTKPVWLAGGLRLHNVREAMSTVRPTGIDVETGMQNPDGSKNYTAIEQFITLVHDFE